MTPEMPEVPDFFEPILVYREWEVTRWSPWREAQTGPRDAFVPKLRSRAQEWPTFQALEAAHIDPWSGNATAECAGSPCDGHVPYATPKCGIYGFKTAALHRVNVLRDHINSARSLFGMTVPERQRIVGICALWGRLVEHDHGWRGQFAYPVKFLYASADVDGRAVAATYGVPYEEDLSWKLETPSDDSSLNHWSHQSLYFLNQSLFSPSKSQPAFWNQPPSVFSHPWPSQRLHPPSALKLIHEPKRKKTTFEQPTFHLHRPTAWWKQNGVWQRTERLEEVSL